MERYEAREVGTKSIIIDTTTGERVARNGVTEWGNWYAANGWAQKLNRAEETGNLARPEAYRNPYIGGL